MIAYYGLNFDSEEDSRSLRRAVHAYQTTRRHFALSKPRCYLNLKHNFRTIQH
jgi:hypothetical protein